MGEGGSLSVGGRMWVSEGEMGKRERRKRDRSVGRKPKEMKSTH